MEKWVKEIEESIEGATVVLEGAEGSCSRVCKIISLTFEKMPLLSRHRLVKNILKKHFEDSLHALSIQTYTPEEWNNGRFN